MNMKHFSSTCTNWIGRRLHQESMRHSGKPTPLPPTKLAVVLLIRISQVFGQIVLFPFLPFMVQDFFPELSKEELGRKAGYLGSAYFIGNFGGSMMWGWISDTWGRRPTILCGCMGIIFSSLLFGFSQNFTTAITARFLWGFLNGNGGVIKTYLSEILDDTNQAKAFSIYGVASGIGDVIVCDSIKWRAGAIGMGVIAGGFLSQPASKYSLLQNSVFCEFKYILPIFINVGITFISLVVTILFMEETLRNITQQSPVTASHSDDEQSSDRSSIASNIIEIARAPLITTNDNNHTIETDNSTDDGNPKDSNNQIINTNTNTDADRIIDTDLADNCMDSNHLSSDTDALLQHDLSLLTKQHKHLPKRRGTSKTNIFSRIDWLHPFKSLYKAQTKQLIECCFCFVYCNKQNLQTTSTLTPKQVLKKILNKITLMIKLLMDRSVMLSILCYGLTGGVMVMSKEILLLLLVTDHAHGGYNMDDNEISVFIMICSVVILIYQVFIYPWLTKLIGYRHMFRITMFVFAVFIVLIPWSNTITGPINGNSSDSEHNMSGSGMSGSGMGPSDIGYCGYAVFKSNYNENSIARLPFKIWLVLLVLLLPILIARVTSIVTATVLVNNSALKSTRGTVNGLSQSLVAIFKAIGPLFGSLLFAWSEGNGMSWPINYHFMFELSALFAVATIGFSLCIPKSIEKKRD